MKKILVPILLFGCLSHTLPVLAQNCFDVIKNNPLYSNPDEIVNGRKWIPSSGYIGSSMLKENYWPNADILYNNTLFRSIRVNYDIFRDELIIYYPEKSKERYVVINKDHLSWFSIKDSIQNRNRLFEYTGLSNTGEKALYERIPTKKISFFIKPVVKFDATPSQKTLGRYTLLNQYFLDSGKGFVAFRSKRELLKLLANRRTEFNRFIRKQNLQINDKHPEDVAKAVTWYDGIN